VGLRHAHTDTYIHPSTYEAEVHIDAYTRISCPTTTCTECTLYSLSYMCICGCVYMQLNPSYPIPCPPPSPRPRAR
jgi:hypothetical protein